MPSTRHQGLSAILRDDPELIFDLLRSIFGIEFPALKQFTDRKGELDRFTPCFGDTGELRLDLVVSAEAKDVSEEGVAVLVEVQAEVDKLKRFRIWVYWALLAEQLQRSTCVVLIPMHDSVSRWARGLGARELPPREALLVLDRQNMPRITSLDEGRQRPSLAVLSAMIHGAVGDFEVFNVGIQIALEMTDERRLRYPSFLMSVLPDEQQDIIIGALSVEQIEKLTEVELNSAAFHNGRRKGALEGKLEGKLETLLSILELRGLTLPPGFRQRIEACRDPDRLGRWTVRAVQARTVEELFVES